MKLLESIRRCAACGKKGTKNSFIRISRSPKINSDVNIKVLDLTENLSYHEGRSGYLCPDASCLKKAKKFKRLEKNLSCKVSEDVYEEIQDLLNKLGGMPIYDDKIQSS